MSDVGPDGVSVVLVFGRAWVDGGAGKVDGAAASPSAMGVL